MMPACSRNPFSKKRKSEVGCCQLDALEVLAKILTTNKRLQPPASNLLLLSVDLNISISTVNHSRTNEHRLKSLRQSSIMQHCNIVKKSQK